MKLITCTTRLYENQNQRLLEIKEETGLPVSSLIREAVRDYLEAKAAVKAKKYDDWIFNEYEEVSNP